MIAVVAATVREGLGWNLVDDMRQLFELHFMVNAFRAGTIVAVVAGAMGWFTVLRRQSFAGHALAVVSFPGAAGAVWLGASATAGTFVASVSAALVIALVPRSASGGGDGEDSAVIGTVQALALASGVLFVSLYGGFLNSLNGLLFGTFLGITDDQVTTLIIVGAAVLAVLAGIGRPLFFATIDADVAQASGVPVRMLSVVFLVLLGCAAAEVSQITGSLLVFALLVLPAASAQRLTSRPGSSFVLTIVLAVAITWVALAAAYFSVHPIGFFVTTIGLGVFVVVTVAQSAKVRIQRRGRSGFTSQGLAA